MNLLEAILQLPALEQDQLVREIYKARRAKVQNPQGDAKRYITILCKITGVPDFQLHKRDRTFVWIRTMAAYRLILDGHTPTEVGELIGKDHATIDYYIKKMEDVFNLPSAYKYENKVWDIFKKELNK